KSVDLAGDDLQRFHDNKSIFIDLGIRENFNIPKFHNISHYPMFIKLVGILDNCNTEHTERLHIDFAKDAYRATNCKDEYLQMTLWLERKEKILCHDKFICWRCAGSPPPTTKNSDWRPADHLQHRHLEMTKSPSVYGVKVPTLSAQYGAINFRDAFTYFVIGFKNPEFSRRQREVAADNFFLPFQSVSVYHTINFWNEDPLGWEDKSDALNVVHVKPGYVNKQGRIIGGRFDTVIVNDGTGKHSGGSGYRVGQVRVVFSLTERALKHLFPNERPHHHLAYVEWFSKFPNTPEPNHAITAFRPLIGRGCRALPPSATLCLPYATGSAEKAEHSATIIPVANIHRSVQLFPEFGPIAPRDWTSQNVLERCRKFYVSPWSDRHSYVTIR
ncbi:hypothetical protein DFH08DRAFT_724710, partial [Mycena albidolilacea]